MEHVIIIAAHQLIARAAKLVKEGSVSKRTFDQSKAAFDVAKADQHADMIEEIRGEGLMQGIRLRKGTPCGDFVGGPKGWAIVLMPLS